MGNCRGKHIKEPEIYTNIKFDKTSRTPPLPQQLPPPYNPIDESIYTDPKENFDDTIQMKKSDDVHGFSANYWTVNPEYESITDFPPPLPPKLSEQIDNIYDNYRLKGTNVFYFKKDEDDIYVNVDSSWKPTPAPRNSLQRQFSCA